MGRGVWKEKLGSQIHVIRFTIEGNKWGRKGKCRSYCKFKYESKEHQISVYQDKHQRLENLKRRQRETLCYQRGRVVDTMGDLGEIITSEYKKITSLYVEKEKKQSVYHNFYIEKK